MTGYSDLEARLGKKEIILLDGAIGTQLQKMDVPMNNRAWAAMALHGHPFTVQRMHELYIRAGVDVITTNTYAAARHNLEPLGHGELTRELNLRAVMLAEAARDRTAKDRPVYIAGSVSNYGLMIGSEPGWRTYAYFKGRSVISEEQARANLREQAEILAESGVDFLIAESTGGNTHRKWVVEACAATGLPLWTGFKCRLDEDDPAPRLGYRSEQTFADGFDEVIALGGSVVNLFHTSIAATNAALPLLKERWQGPIGLYPEADRRDYVATHRDPGEEVHVTPDDFVAQAREWVGQGVQIIGGCCGIELEHIEPLREALPTHLPG
jgi:S-methylmethionine-dependent homocysteine/selenocysteine methylase